MGMLGVSNTGTYLERQRQKQTQTQTQTQTYTHTQIGYMFWVALAPAQPKVEDLLKHLQSESSLH